MVREIVRRPSRFKRPAQYPYSRLANHSRRSTRTYCLELCARRLGEFVFMSNEVVSHLGCGKDRTYAPQLGARASCRVTAIVRDDLSRKTLCYIAFPEQILHKGLMTNSQIDFLKSESSQSGTGYLGRVWNVHSIHRAAAS